MLDALQDALGAKPERSELATLSVSEVAAIGERLEEFWRQQADEPIPGGGSLIGGWRSANSSEPAFREDLSDSLLYYPKLMLLDPIADFFHRANTLPEPRGIRYRRRDGQDNTVIAGARLWSSHHTFESLRVEHPDLAASRFAAIVDNLYALEKPIRSGVTVLRSQWPILERRRTQLEAAVRHDVASPDLQAFIASIPPDTVGLTVWDNLQGLQISADGPVREADERWVAEPFFFYIDKMLAVADAYGAQYVAANEQDLELLRRKVTVGLHRSHPGAMLREVADIVVPSVDVPIRQAAAIRANSSDFDDWRSALRTIQRDGSADTPEVLRERVEDTLRPRVNQVRRELESSSLKELVRRDGVDLIIDGAFGMAATILTHDPIATVGATVGAGITQWILKAYTRPKPSGADAVLATLLRDPR